MQRMLIWVITRYPAMATPEGFNVRVLNGLRAHFKQASGPSRPGTDWAISLTNSSGEHRILVRTYADDAGRRSQEREAQLAVEYVGHLIQSGWSPDQYRGAPGELVVPKGFGSAQGTAPSQAPGTGAAVKRSWFQRLFGRGTGR
jgi:hypothetical protein